MVRITRSLLIPAAFVASLAVSLVVGLWLMLGTLGDMRKATAVGGPFQLIDESGHIVTEKNLEGRLTLVFFGYTSLFEISEVPRAMGKDADRINAYFITIDPARDTSVTMKEYLSSFDPHLQGLTGDPGAVAKVITEYRAYAKKVPLKDGDYTIDHTALVYLMGSDGKFVAPFNLKRTPQEAAADLKRYLQISPRAWLTLDKFRIS
jgi:protein SCO1